MTPTSQAMRVFELVSEVHNVDDGRYLWEIGFTEGNGGSARTIYVPRGMNVNQLSSMLLDFGAHVPAGPGAAKRELQAALAQPPKRTGTVTNTTGWHGYAFTLEECAFGPRDICVPFVRPLSPRKQTFGCTKGKLSDWKAGLADACAASSYLTFSIALALGGILLVPTNQDEGGTFYLCGESTVGKSLCAVAAQSVVGPAQRSLMLTHDVTPRALEEQLRKANHILLVIDELARFGGSKAKMAEWVRHVAHLVASGRGRVRSNTVADFNLPNVQFMTLGFMSGEFSLEELIDGGRYSGEQARLIQISAPRRAAGGIFDRLTDQKLAKRLARQVENVTASNHGLAVRAFLQMFVSDYERQSARAFRLIQKFLRHVQADDPYSRRIAAKFGVVYAAGYLAAKSGIVPWRPSWTRKCIAKLYRNARRNLLSVGEAAEALTLRISELSKDESKFPTVPKGATFPREYTATAYGISRVMAGQEVLAVFSSRFDELLPSSLPRNQILGELARRGTILKGKEAGRYVRQVQVQGRGSKREDFICILRQQLPAAETSRRSKGQK